MLFLLWQFDTVPRLQRTSLLAAAASEPKLAAPAPISLPFKQCPGPMWAGEMVVKAEKKQIKKTLAMEQ